MMSQNKGRPRWEAKESYSLRRARTRLVPCLYPIKNRVRLRPYHSMDFIWYAPSTQIWRHASRYCVNYARYQPTMFYGPWLVGIWRNARSTSKRDVRSSCSARTWHKEWPSFDSKRGRPSVCDVNASGPYSPSIQTPQLMWQFAIM